MRNLRWITIAAVAACVACSAWADDHGSRGNNNSNNGNGNNGNGNSVFESALVGSVPNTTIGGVTAGGVPWVVASSDATLSADGRLHVDVSGLLIANVTGVPANLVGTVGPVQMVGASLACGGAVTASSDGAPLSARGNAQIDATLTLPATCMSPTVLVRIFTASAPLGSQLGPFIAVTGFNAGAVGNNNNNNNNDHGDHDN
jgi:hypothetical protein